MGGKIVACSFSETIQQCGKTSSYTPVCLCLTANIEWKRSYKIPFTGSTETGPTHLCDKKKIGFLCVGAIICEGTWEGASWGARNILCLGSGCSNVGGFIRKNLSKTKFYVIFGLRNTIYKILQPKALNMNPINFNGDFQFPETIGIEEQAEWLHEEATRPIRRPPLLQDRPPHVFHRRTWTRPGELKGHPIERPCKTSVWILVWTNQL